MSASIHHIARAIVDLSTDNQAQTHIPSTRVTTTIATAPTRRGHRRRRDDTAVGAFPGRLVFTMPLASLSLLEVVHTSFGRQEHLEPLDRPALVRERLLEPLDVQREVSMDHLTVGGREDRCDLLARHRLLLENPHSPCCHSIARMRSARKIARRAAGSRCRQFHAISSEGFVDHQDTATRLPATRELIAHCGYRTAASLMSAEPFPTARDGS